MTVLGPATIVGGDRRIVGVARAVAPAPDVAPVAAGQDAVVASIDRATSDVIVRSVKAIVPVVTGDEDGLAMSVRHVATVVPSVGLTVANAGPTGTSAADVALPIVMRAAVRAGTPAMTGAAVRAGTPAMTGAAVPLEISATIVGGNVMTAAVATTVGDPDSIEMTVVATPGVVRVVVTATGHHAVPGRPIAMDGIVAAAVVGGTRQTVQIGPAVIALIVVMTVALVTARIVVVMTAVLATAPIAGTTVAGTARIVATIRVRAGAENAAERRPTVPVAGVRTASPKPVDVARSRRAARRVTTVLARRGGASMTVAAPTAVVMTAAVTTIGASMSDLMIARCARSHQVWSGTPTNRRCLRLTSSCCPGRSAQN